MIYSEKNIIFALEYQLYWLMAKGKNRGKRLTKKRLVEMLSTFFTTNPNETYNLKQIFKQLHLLTHPEKMLAIDIMEEMAWDDFLSKVSENSYKLWREHSSEKPTERTHSLLMALTNLCL